jgi:hypothetical protein
MAGEADSVASWFQEAFGGGGGGGYATVQGNGTAATQRTVLDLVAGAGVTVTVADDGASSPPRTKATVTASGGGPVTSGPFTALGPTTLTRSGTWMRQSVGTSANAVGLKAPASAAENDQLDFVDVDRKWGTHAFTFDGNGHQVEDPMNPDAPLASTWTSPAGWNDLSVSWQLLRNSAATLIWKVV